jgi:hypothetical protein
MAKAGTKAAVVLVLFVSVVGSRPASAQDGTVRIVLHLSDFYHLPPNELDSAKHWAERPYARIGVHVVWSDGAAATAPSDGARHFDVVILSEGMTREKMPVDDALGEASAVTARAYIHYSRILAFSRRTTSDPLTVLAMVMAHELGHMLLPGSIHTSAGLMRGHWEGFIAGVPPFLSAQAAAIRATLTQVVAESDKSKFAAPSMSWS